MNKVLSKSLPILVTGALLTPLAAQAVPSFARQTGMSCAMCHTVFPQLTPYGRMFKLQGYTTAAGMFNAASEQHSNLSEDTMAPLAAMLQVSYSSMKKGQAPDSNGNQNTKSPGSYVEMPQQFSFFYAGRISDHMGAFVQATIDNTGSAIAMDNTDIRYANTTATAGGGNLVYGLSINNAPTVEDILNTTPVWAGVPSSGPDNTSYNAPDEPILVGADPVSTHVGGLVAYGMLNNTWYGAVGAYHYANGGSGTDPIINSSWAPYARIAYQKDNGTNNFDIGAYTMSADMVEGKNVSDTTASKSSVTDVGVDGQYQILNGTTTFTGRLSYQSEKINNPGNIGLDFTKVNKTSLSGTYFYDRMYGGSLGYVVDSGDAATGGTKPDSSYFIAEADYLPWLNTKFSLQYTAYNKINNVTSHASDANTLYALAWFMF